MVLPKGVQQEPPVLALSLPKAVDGHYGPVFRVCRWRAVSLDSDPHTSGMMQLLRCEQASHIGREGRARVCGPSALDLGLRHRDIGRPYRYLWDRGAVGGVGSLSGL